jgi:hypothetical protein
MEPADPCRGPPASKSSFAALDGLLLSAKGALLSLYGEESDQTESH